MANPYIIYQDKHGYIRVAKRGLFGRKVQVGDTNGRASKPFNDVTEAETFLHNLETNRRNISRAEAKAVAEAGVKYVFDCKNDQELTIRNKFRVCRTSKNEDAPFYLEELMLRGWMKVYKKGSSDVLELKKFSTLGAAKVELLAIVQKLQEVENRRKRARVLKVIDARVYELTEDSELANASA